MDKHHLARGSAALRCLAPALCCAGLLACSAGANKHALLDALHEYNDGVRWQRTNEVGGYIYDVKKRAAFLIQSERRRDVRVSGTRIQGVRLGRDGTAFVTVSIDWYSLRTAQVSRTVMRQTWHRKAGQWRVTDQRWVQGATFPLFAVAVQRRPAPR